MVKHLPSKFEVLSLNPGTDKSKILKDARVEGIAVILKTLTPISES
jgi:hypothetical protein